MVCHRRPQGALQVLAQLSICTHFRWCLLAYDIYLVPPVRSLLTAGHRPYILRCASCFQQRWHRPCSHEVVPSLEDVAAVKSQRSHVQ